MAVALSRVESATDYVDHADDEKKADKDDESKGDALLLLLLLLLERRPCSIYYLQGLIGHCIEIAPWPRVAVTSFNPPLRCDNLTSHP